MQIPSKSAQFIEPILPQFFHFNNSYWITYFVNGNIYDKKYVFTAHTVDLQHCTLVPVLDKNGVLHA